MRLFIVSGTTKLIFPNGDLDDIMKIIKSLQESDLLIKGVNTTIKNEAKDLSVDLSLSMLLGTLGASLLGNMLAGKGVMRAGEGAIRADEQK